MDLDHTLALHCVVGVGKDLVYGAWMSLISFHTTIWHQNIGIRSPKACMSDTSVIAWCRELLSVSIACALGWGVASIGILLY